MFKSSYFFRFGFLLISAFIIFACSNEKESRSKADSIADTAESDKSLALISAQLEKEPGNAGLFHQRAQLYLKEKNFQNAFTDINQAIKLDSSRADFFQTLSDIFFASGKIYNSKDALEKCLQADPENNDCRSRLAEIFFILKKYNEALQHTALMIQKNPHDPKAYFIQGMVSKEAGDTTGAIRNFQKAIEKDDGFYNAYMQLGVLFTARNNAVCLEYFNSALKINPRSEEALYGRALWEQEHDALDEAIRDYTSIAQLNPKNKNAHFNLGYIHYTYLKVYDQAIKHYDDAIASDSNYPEAFYNRGLCYEALGNITQAKSDYEKAVSLRPDYKPALQGINRIK